MSGKVLIITRTLYVLKSACASFMAFMANQLNEMGLKSSTADPDVWTRAATKPDGEHYYEYILVYVDDIIAVSHKARDMMSEICSVFKFKNNKVSKPETYLGARLQQKSINGKSCWTMTSVDYINAAVKNIEKATKDSKWKIPSRAKTTMISDYVPEFDDTPDLDAKDTQYFQEIIGMAIWRTEIGRVKVLHEISRFSQYQASPRKGPILWYSK